MTEINPLEIYTERAFKGFISQNGLTNASLEEQIRKYQAGMNNTSSFFRNLLLEIGVEHLIDTLQSPIKIAVVGCSNGQEAYTLMLRNWGNRDKFTLRAIDINENYLEAVRNGIYRLPYTSDQFKLINDNPKQSEICDMKYLDILGFPVTQVEITFKESVKERIRTEQYDILNAPLSDRYDILTMCNLLLYYTDNNKKQIMRNCAESMNPGGLLFLDDFYNLYDFVNLLDGVDSFDKVKLEISGVNGPLQVLAYRKK